MQHLRLSLYVLVLLRIIEELSYCTKFVADIDWSTQLPKHYEKTTIGLRDEEEIVQSRHGFGMRAIVCLLVAICLEIATLKGARTSSPLVADDWLLVRASVFWVLTLLISTVFDVAITNDRIRSVGRFLVDNCRAFAKRKRTIGLALLISVLFSLAVTNISVTKTGYIDFRLSFTSFSVLISILLIVLNWSEIQVKLEYLFLLIAVPFGLCYCVLMPFIPEISWDGQIHFRNANCLSFLMNAEFTEADILMTDPYAVTTLGLLGSGEISSVWNPNQDVVSLNQAQEQAARLDRFGSVTVCDGFSKPLSESNGESYLSASVVGVLPQAIGLWTGRLLGMSIIGRLLIARIFSSIFYIVIVFYGIKSLRKGKILVSTLALLITPFLMASNFSYDPWCFALFIFSACHFVGKLQEGPCSLDTYSVLVILISFTIGCLAKAVYFPLILVLLATPRNYYSDSCSKKKVGILIGLSIVFLAATFVIPTLVASLSGTEVPDTRAQPGVSSSGQIKFALMHPRFFAKTMLTFVVSFISTMPITASLGSYFPYLYNSPDILGYLSWVLVICALVFDCNEKDFAFGCKLRVSAVITLVISLLLSIAALYAAFTPVGFDTVLGYQWRYLIQLYPVFFLIVVSLPKPLSKLSFGCRFNKAFPVAFAVLEFTYQFINLYYGFLVKIV